MMIQNIINNLSGAIALPLFENMCKRISISDIKRIYELLNGLYEQGCKRDLFTLIHIIITFSQIEIPQDYYSLIGDLKTEEEFVGELLADLQDILCEFE